MPYRIQRKRTKGWRMPANTIYIGRPTKWGNPFIVGRFGNAQECVERYTHGLSENGGLVSCDDLHELRGKNLACWCSLDQPCHGDALLQLANA
jgi:hypothetical protein